MKMEDNKKMPFAVFVLKYVENVLEQNKNICSDEFYTLDTCVLNNCDACPLADKCCGTRYCYNTLKEYVESAE
jgi:hypothetical protein